MYRLEKGILSTSKLYFFSATEFAHKSLYYIQELGIFDCDNTYAVIRQHWHEESFLLIFLDKGNMKFVYQHENFTAHAGDIILLNCQERHRYIATTNVHFRFFHFNGIAARHYFNLLYKLNKGFMTGSDYANLNDIFNRIFRLACVPILNEHRISVYIHSILGEMVQGNRACISLSSDVVEKAVHYMELHICDNISMSELAAQIHLNTYYFSRCFKKHTGISPHQYYLNLRIQYAKYLLITSFEPVSTIAEKCGFDNTSNFIRTFKRETSTTPSNFRKIEF